MGFQLLKRKEPSSKTPAHDALRTHWLVFNANLRERTKVNARVTWATQDIQRAVDIGATILQARASIDLKLGSALYNGQDQPALREEPEALQDLERQLVQAESARRLATAILPDLQADLNAINKANETNRAASRPLLRAAILEDMESMAPALCELGERYRELHRRLYVRALALDKMAIADGTGKFVSSGLYGDLNLAMPLIPAVNPEAKLPEAVLRERTEDFAALDLDSDLYISELMIREA